jgi:hypothetical protein
VVNRDISPGNGDEASQPCLARQQIIEGVVQPPIGNVESNGEQTVFIIVQEAHVY